MKWKALVATALMLTAAVAPVTAAGGQGSASTYAGTHVKFDAQSNAVVDYTINGNAVAERIEVQSKSKARSSGGITADTSLKAVTSSSFVGAAVSVQATAEANAVVKFGSGAKMHAHDNSRGVMQIKANGESQYVHVDLASGASAESTSEDRVVITTKDGTKGTYIVVGEGQVTVNEKGNVTAELGSNSQLVYRQYPEGRSEEDKKQEQMIADGVVAAEVYVMEQTKKSGDTVTDVVSYGQETTVTVKERTKSKLVMTAESSQKQGKVILTTISNQAFKSVEDIQVKVDGEAAAKASSYSALRAATKGGDTSKFLVRQQSSAEASADVLVAINHFSTRDVTMSSGGGATATPTEGGGGGGGSGGTNGGGPGFGVFAALAAIGAALAVLRVRE